MKITVDTILKWNPCSEFTRKDILELCKEVNADPEGITIRDVCNANIRNQDKLWVLLRSEFIPEKTLHETSIYCWEEIVKPVYDNYNLENKELYKYVEIKKLWMQGEITDTELVNHRQVLLNISNRIDMPLYACYDAVFSLMHSDSNHVRYTAHASVSIKYNHKDLNEAYNKIFNYVKGVLK